VIALASAVLLSVLSYTPGSDMGLAALNDKVFYDTFYRLRPTESQQNGPVVVVAVDDDSLRRMEHAPGRPMGWPWPRDQYAAIIKYAEKCGAKAVAFDILFSESSVWADTFDDDAALAAAAADAKIPVIFGIRPEGPNEPGRFAPRDPDHAKFKPLLGSVAVTESVLRRYNPWYSGEVPSLAVATLRAIGADARDRDPFLLHFYGPNPGTFRYLAAADVIDAFKGAVQRAPPELLKDKIVVVGAIAPGLMDIKQSPFAGIYPGVEYQATALVDLLNDQKVRQESRPIEGAVLLASALIGGIGAGFPRRATRKFALGFVAIFAPIMLSFLLFRSPDIRWLPPAQPVLAAALAVVSALLWSYLREDRKRRFFLKALGQYLSPAVADQLARNPGLLQINSERREMTVMFSDIAGFTDLSEKLEAEALKRLLNFYLEEMSSQVLAQNGTLDKYVGDAIMSFWNAPLPQPDHAIRACRAALAKHRREIAIAPDLKRLGGGDNMHTRLGINTGIMAVGNMGCSQKFNYSVLGDSVNLASRLEGTNKMYGTSIIVSESTADRVRDHFLIRKIDVIRVKGKLKPVAIFELMGELPGNPETVWLASTYNQALEAYQRQNWDESEKIILAIREKFPEDGPCRTLSNRISHFRHEPPPPDWDGVYVAKEK